MGIIPVRHKECISQWGPKRGDIYEIPPSFEEKGKVCRLKKSLYELKQSPSAWFKKFSTTLHQLGYQQGHSNQTLFTKHAANDLKTILIAYVNDIIITSDNQ